MSFSHIKSTARWTVLSVLYIDIPEPPVVLLFPGKEEPCFFLQGLGLDAPALLFPDREQLNGVRALTLQGAGNLITEAFQAHRCHLVTDRSASCSRSRIRLSRLSGSGGHSSTSSTT